MIEKQHETLEDIIMTSGIKLDRIASKMGISTNYLWKLRKNPSSMSMVQMESLAYALGVSIARVFEAVKNFKD